MMRAKPRPPISEAEREEAARLILAEYFGFLRKAPPPAEIGDTKAASGRHAAGKGILSHLEQLFRTAGGAGAEAAAEASAGGHQLDAARAAMASLEGEESEGDDDDAGDG